jgi:biotin carboxyl carrier protein
MIKQLRITLEGKTYDVEVEVLGEEGQRAPSASGSSGAVSMAPPNAAPAAKAPAPVAAGDGVVPSPLAAVVVSVDVAAGAEVEEGQKLLTLEAMKMNTFVNAPQAGKVEEILVHAGDAVEEGQGLVKLG